MLDTSAPNSMSLRGVKGADFDSPSISSVWVGLLVSPWAAPSVLVCSWAAPSVLVCSWAARVFALQIPLLP